MILTRQQFVRSVLRDAYLEVRFDEAAGHQLTYPCMICRQPIHPGDDRFELQLANGWLRQHIHEHCRHEYTDRQLRERFIWALTQGRTERWFDNGMSA